MIFNATILAGRSSAEWIEANTPVNSSARVSAGTIQLRRSQTFSLARKRDGLSRLTRQSSAPAW
jgi:hypothetical protein